MSGVVVFSGHMTDSRERAVPRFPKVQEAPVRKAITAALDAWNIGPSDVCLSSGARGSDLIFAECCIERGAHLRLLLPLPIEAFVARSVNGGAGDWEPRFHKVVQAADVQVPDGHTEHARQGSPFAMANGWLLETAATMAAPARPRVLVVWDGRPGDGAGGTADFVAKARQRGWLITVIDPLSP